MVYVLINTKYLSRKQDIGEYKQSDYKAITNPLVCGRKDSQHFQMSKFKQTMRCHYNATQYTYNNNSKRLIEVNIKIKFMLWTMENK